MKNLIIVGNTITFMKAMKKKSWTKEQNKNLLYINRLLDKKAELKNKAFITLKGSYIIGGRQGEKKGKIALSDYL